MFNIKTTHAENDLHKDFLWGFQRMHRYSLRGTRQQTSPGPEVIIFFPCLTQLSDLLAG